MMRPHFEILFHPMVACAVLCALTSQAAPSNDMFSAAVVLDGTVGSVGGDNTDATMEPGEDYPVGAKDRSVWYAWEAPRNCQMNMRTDRSVNARDLTLYVCTGDIVSNVTLVATDSISGGADGSLVVFPAVSGVVYRVQVTAYTYGSYAAGPFLLDWAETGSGPPNDNFADAEALPGTVGEAIAYTTNATVELGEPLYNDAFNGGKSVWFEWTAPTNGIWAFATDGSDFDTLLGIYTGQQVQALQGVAWDDDAEFDYSASQIRLPVTMGVTYRILVDGFESASGRARLAYAPMCTNDDRTNAVPLGGVFGHAFANNLGATEDADGYGGWLRSVWYTWTATSGQTINFNTAGSAFDTNLRVYQGSPTGPLSLVVENDDAETGLPLSEVSFDAVAGTNYCIAVSGARSPAKGVACGQLCLNWFPHPAYFTAQRLTGDEIVLTFLASPSETFNLQTNADLATGTWGTVTNVPGCGAPQAATNLVELPQLFYRLETSE